MDGQGGLARYHLLVGEVPEDETAAGGSLPVEELTVFLLNTENDPEARVFAFDLMAKAEDFSGFSFITIDLTDGVLSVTILKK